jgi:CBS domain-containing protein
MGKMRVQDLMTKDVSCCDPSTNVAAAAEIMWNKNCGALPVVGNEGRVVGIVTDRDLFIALGTTNRIPAQVPVGEIMNCEPVCCMPSDDLRTALQTMAARQIQRLPVVDNAGGLKGVLSVDDVVMRAEAEGLSSDLVLGTLKAIWGRQVQRKAGELTGPAARAAAA